MRHRNRNSDPFPGALDTQRIERDRFWEVVRQGTLLAIALHAVFAIAGWLLDAMPLVYMQAVTVAVYCGSFVFTSRGYYKLATAMAWVDLLGHATLACWMLGVESGFQYYSWILLPLVFTNVNRRFSVKVGLAVALSVFYVVIDGWLRRTTPLLHVDPFALSILRYFNIACYLLAMGIIAVAYGRMVKDAERRLHALASTDTLTGLLNRRRMSDQMQKELEQARGQPLAVLLLDIDHFKSINDQFGHARGDQVIVAFGEVLRANVRQNDLVARWGGEEFLVMQPNTPIDRAIETAERIRDAVSQCMVRHDLDPTPITVTVGIASWRRGESLDDTIHRADSALYAGKKEGRDRVIVADEQPALLPQKLRA